MAETAYYQINRDIILNRAKNYYNSNIETLREKTRNKCWELPEEEKNKKREYAKNRCHSMSEEKKKRPKEYQKEYQEKYCETKKQLLKNQNAVGYIFPLLF